MKIGIFGGSFDPPHLSHLSVCAFALSLTDIDEVWVVPVFEHAFGKSMASFEHRARMCELAFRDLRRTRVSDIERRIGGTSYTVRTLERVAAERPEASLALITGADAVRDRRSWHRFDRVTQLAELVVFGRQGVELDRAALPAPPGISSTRIREQLSRGEPVSPLVPRAVLRYIGRHDLYRR